MDTKDFIKKAKEVHGNKYDYSKVEYVNNATKVCIICPEHGEFWQKPQRHLSGQRCRKCSCEAIRISHSNTTDDFIKKAKKIHGDKYDYSKVEYVNTNTKVCIICPEHGEFWQTPHNHLAGHLCQKCGNKVEVLNQDDFIKKAKEIHNEKYDYSKVKYIKSIEKVCIICPEHGEFWQTPHMHLKGAGCPKCGRKRTVASRKLSNDIFIERARKIHGYKYDYSKVECNGGHNKVCIICPEHGEFWQTPSKHLFGRGCPVCSESQIERTVRVWLEKNNIEYSKDKKFDWLINKTNLKLDFYLPKYNIAIECQGIQHFKPIRYFNGQEGYNYLTFCDNLKKKLCSERNIPIIYINYDEDIEEAIKVKMRPILEELAKIEA